MTQSNTAYKLYVRKTGDTADLFLTGAENCEGCREELDKTAILYTSFKYGFQRRAYCLECATTQRVSVCFLLDEAPSIVTVNIVSKPPKGARLRLPTSSPLQTTRGVTVFEAARKNLETREPELQEDRMRLAVRTTPQLEEQKRKRIAHQ